MDSVNCLIGSFQQVCCSDPAPVGDSVCQRASRPQRQPTLFYDSGTLEHGTIRRSHTPKLVDAGFVYVEGRYCKAKICRTCLTEDEQKQKQSLHLRRGGLPTYLMAQAAEAAAQSEVEEVVSDGLTLDLTNSHLRTLADVPLALTLTALDLTANRLTRLEPNLLALSGLRTLSLRQNLLEDASEVARLASAGRLTELILHDNRLHTVPDLTPLMALRRLELSYNGIKSLRPLTSLVGQHLSDLYVASNNVSSAEGIGHLTALTLLELGSNRVKDLGPIMGLTGLRELWLGRNRLTSLDGLSRLTNLQRLALLSNRLESVAGLSACTALQELYLSHNGLTALEGFETLRSLKILDVANNRITSLPALSVLEHLQDLWLSENALAAWPAVLDRLAGLRSSLKCLYLAGNPATADMAAVQADLLRRGFDKLEQLDDKVLTPSDASGGGDATEDGSFGTGIGRRLGTV